MSANRRIASLLRELAEQFDRLEEERRPSKRTPRLTEAPEQTPDPEVMRRVQRGLRRAGLKA